MEKFSTFARSVVGESPILRGVYCQDSSLAVNHKDFCFAAVADGHGSPCYLRTDRGSRFAVICALECVSEFLEALREAEEMLEDEKQRLQLFTQLWRSIVSRWHEMTEQDYIGHPFTAEELERIPQRYAFYRDRYLDGNYIDAYGTTLVFAVMTREFAFCGQIGDGSCVAIDCDGGASEPVPEDPRCHENVTTSMCQDDAVLSGRFTYFSADALPAAIFLGTDGIENSYWSKQQLYGFYQGLALTFSEYELAEADKQLHDFLPEMTRKGSGDDVSCAGIFCRPALEAISDTLMDAVRSVEDDETDETPRSKNIPDEE